MKKYTKRLLAFLMATVMVLTGLPLSAKEVKAASDFTVDIRDFVGRESATTTVDYTEATAGTGWRVNSSLSTAYATYNYHATYSKAMVQHGTRNAYYAYDFTAPAAGTYNLSLTHIKVGGSGIAHMWVNGVYAGTANLSTGSPVELLGVNLKEGEYANTIRFYNYRDTTLSGTNNQFRLQDFIFAVPTEETPLRTLVVDATAGATALEVGDTTTIEATYTVPTATGLVFYENKGDYSYSYVSSNSDVIAVDGANITAVAPGDATVTVTLLDAGTAVATDTIEFTVVQGAPKYDSAKMEGLFDGATLNLGDEPVQLSVAALLNDGNPVTEGLSVEWASDTADVVDVTADGILTTVGLGTATITAAVSHNGEYKETLSADVEVLVAGAFRLDFSDVDTTTLLNDSKVEGYTSGSNRLYTTSKTKSKAETSTPWSINAELTNNNFFAKSVTAEDGTVSLTQTTGRYWHDSLVPTFLKIMGMNRELVIDFVAPAAGEYNLDVNLFVEEAGGETSIFVNEEYVGSVDAHTGNAATQKLLTATLVEGINTISFIAANSSGTGSKGYCGLYSVDFTPANEDVREVTSLEVILDTTELDIAGNTTAQASITATTNADVLIKGDYNYSSSETKVASITRTGVITAKSEGTADIIVTVGDVTASETLTVIDSRPRYTVTWVDDDGTVLEIDGNKLEGDTVSFGAGEPTKAADAQYTYTFAGWYPEVGVVTGDTTYTATYDKTVNSYTVKFVVKGEVVSEEVYEYGTMPVVPEVSDYEDADYTYTFTGWDATVSEVTGDVTYTACFEASVQSYMITFVDEDGTVLDEIMVAPGDAPVYTGETPTKAPTTQYTYVFKGWTPELAEVTGSETYTAVYEAILNEYDITWVVDGVSTTEKVAYGLVPAYEGTPSKAATAQYTYTFAGWDVEPVEVTGDATYTAKFDATVNEYEITFVVNGTETKATYAYGATPEAPETPDYSDADNVYTFANWDKEIVAVEGEATYTAVFAATAFEAKIDGVGYTTLAAAVEAAEAGDTITLAKDVTVAEKITIAADDEITLNLASKALTLAVGDDSNYDIVVKGDLTIEGEGNVVVESTYGIGVTGNLTVNGGTYTTSDTNYYVIGSWGTTTINGGDYDVAYMAANGFGGKVTITDGNFKSADEDYVICAMPGCIAVTGGTFDRDVTDYCAEGLAAAPNGDGTYGIEETYTITFIVNGETVSETEYLLGAEVTVPEVADYEDADYTYAFTGWDSEVVAVAGDATYTAVFEATEKYYAASIGDTRFATFAVAYEAAVAGDEIVMNDDLTMSDILVIDKAITLNGNGHTLTSTAGRAINVSGADGVTIKNLTINASGERAINVIQGATNVTIENVTATAANYAINVAASAANAVIAVSDSDLTGLNTVNVAADGVVVTITDTKITCDDQTEVEGYAAISVNADNVTVTVAGGEVVVNGDSTAANLFGQDSTVTFEGTAGETEVKEIVAKIGAAGFYTLQEAISYASEKGGTVVLNRDFALDTTVVNTGVVTLDLNGKTITGTDNNTIGNFYLINNNKGDLTITDSVGGGKITLVATTERNWSASSVVVANNLGTVTLKAGTIEHLGGTSMAYGIDNLTNGKNTVATLNIEGGKVDSTYFAIRQFANNGTNNLNISGGEVTYAWMQSPNANVNVANISVTGGTVEGICLTGKNADLTMNVAAGTTGTVYGTAPTGMVIVGSAETGFSVEKVYTVSFVVNGEVVSEAEYLLGAEVTVPEVADYEDDFYTYTFAGWDSEVVAVAGDATYTAVFDVASKGYADAISTNGNSYGELTVDGNVVTLNVTGEVPYAKGTGTYWGNWIGFDIVAPEGVDAANVTILRCDGQTRNLDAIKDGSNPVYAHMYVSAATIAEYGNEYKIDWNSDGNYDLTVVIDLTNATLLETNYTVTWVVDGVETVETYLAGSTVNVPADPTKEADAQYSYTFTGWDKDIVTVVEADATYTAVFEATVNTYTVTWMNFDGTELATETYEYGQTPAYTGATPEFEGSSFLGWSPAVEDVTGDVTYTAQFDYSGIYWTEEDGERVAYYYVNGAVKKNAGVVEIDGYLYFVRYSGKVVFGENQTIKEANTNGLIDAGTYYCYNNGIIATSDVKLSGEIRWSEDETGKLIGEYYVQDELCKDVGLVEVYNEEAGENCWYYVLYSGKVKRNYVADGNRVSQKVAEAKLNNYTGEAGEYTFYEDGVMYDPLATETGKVVEENGSYYYYVDGHLRKDAGLVKVPNTCEWASEYVFVTYSGKLKVSAKQTVKETTCNGHTELIGAHYFDERGCMVQ